MNNKDKDQKAEKKIDEKFELSEEAKITPEQKQHIKRLDDNRMVVSPEPKFESAEGSGEEIEVPEKIENKGGTSENEESKASDSRPQTSKSEEKGNHKVSLESLDFSTSEFIGLLASYEIPLDETMKDLIKEIKERGETHLKREMKKLLSENS